MPQDSLKTGETESRDSQEAARQKRVAGFVRESNYFLRKSRKLEKVKMRLQGDKNKKTKNRL